MGESHASGRLVERLARRKVIAVALAASALLVVTATALAATGDLSQPPGPGGCISEFGGGSCIDGHGLHSAYALTVSPDGKSVYVASYTGNAVARLNRNTTTGAISQPAGTAGCISETGAGPCADGHALDHPSEVAVSADGKNVYVASFGSDAVARFNRNPTTGAISQPAGSAGCISEDGSGPCADGHGFSEPEGVAVSPDGKSVYVTTSEVSDAVVRLNRNTTTGAISQPAGSAGCVSETGAGPCADGHGLSSPFGVEVSPDGKSVYVTTNASDAVVRLNRDTTTGAITQPAGAAGCISETGAGPCADGHALSGTQGMAVSPDGKSVYVSSWESDAVARLNRNTTAGAIGQPAGTAGCISETGAGPCVDGHALSRPQGLAVSPDGKSVYVISSGSWSVARLNRNTTTRAISQPAGSAGCISEDGSGPCADGYGLEDARAVAVSPDGKNVYVASSGISTVVRLNRAP
jgi:DNA-binding beta-propeller fold protein YncE